MWFLRVCHQVSNELYHYDCGKKLFCSSKGQSRLWRSLNLIFNGYRGCSPTPSAAKAKNEWIYTSITPIDLCLHDMYGTAFASYCLISYLLETQILFIHDSYLCSLPCRHTYNSNKFFSLSFFLNYDFAVHYMCVFQDCQLCAFCLGRQRAHSSKTLCAGPPTPNHYFS